VEIRERLSMDLLGEINDAIVLDLIKKDWEEKATEVLKENPPNEGATAQKPED
jgi:hypothetical protein